MEGVRTKETISKWGLPNTQRLLGHLTGLLICGHAFIPYPVCFLPPSLMELAPNPNSFILNPIKPSTIASQFTSTSFNHTHLPTFQTPKFLISSSHLNPPKYEKKIIEKPTMSDILESSKAQNLELRLQTVGPFFRITATSSETNKVLGKAEGLIRVWWKKGKILHLDSIKLTRETLGMDKSIFGIGLFIGAVMIRYGYDCGCKTAELLAINDSDLYHAKLVKFYRRIGFETVHEVRGSSIGDLGHMLVWGGVGTRMDADVERLLVKWCTRFTIRTRANS
ncbi:hypothetical protein OSB04_008545 [Centaurea solstitialis]|uniref:Uncharacterized protein n=1 Tax=Centaurea solstitialis TaxID=347529 RepID=A0AA38TM04_9ASTR|nr:hypothetical protein OSB04_008545 [Centaurea solstitialis]